MIHTEYRLQRAEDLQIVQLKKKNRKRRTKNLFKGMIKIKLQNKGLSESGNFWVPKERNGGEKDGERESPLTVR